MISKVEKTGTTSESTTNVAARDLDGSADTANAQLLRRAVWWFVGAGLLALVAAVLIIPMDHQLSESMRMGHVPGDLRKAIELSEAFAHGSGATAILVCLLLATQRPRRRVWCAIAITAVSGVSANLLKAAFTRARPYTYDAAQASTSDVTGWQFLGSGSFWDASQRSFPSGHTATAWGLAFALSILYPRAAIVFAFLAMLATFQRLVSGAHFPSDTLAGFGIACLTLGLLLSLPKFRRAIAGG